MTIDEAIENIETVLNSDYHYDETIGYQLTSDDFDWLEMAISALRFQKAAEKNEPLTLDELIEMDGQPVWGVDGSGNACYLLVNSCSIDWLCTDKEAGAWDGAFYGMTGDGEHGLHCMGWLAYRRPPKED